MQDESDCTRCGICCEKGGAILHKEDLELVNSGFLTLSQLVTIRQGELVYDTVSSDAGKLRPLEAEVIKIAGKKVNEGKWACIFLAGENNCSIYDNRPLQCKSFSCKDTSELEKMYLHGHLSRADILANAPNGWIELAKIHEENCSLKNLQALIERALNDLEAREALLEAVNYDIAFRQLCAEKANIPENMIDCILGRPVAVFLSSFGLGFVNKGEGIVLEKIGVNMHEQNV